MSYDFSLDRKATVTLGAGSMLLLILVFVAGVLTGLTWRPDQELMAARKPAVPTEKVEAANQAGGGGASTKGAAAPSAAAMDKAQATAAPAAPGSAAAPVAAAPQQPAAPAASPAASGMPAAGATPAAAPASVAPEVPGVQLAVQVGAFLDKANADRLAQRLREGGYTPQIVLGGRAPKQWNLVRVGPYNDWEEAAEIAAVLSRDQATPAVIRPMR